MSNKTAVTLFSGGGVADIGIQDAGFEILCGVELDFDLAHLYECNHEHRLIVGCVGDVDYTQWHGVTLLWASPPCTNASEVNRISGGESATDIHMANSVCRAIREMQPEHFVLENVIGYRKFTSFTTICNCLLYLGYVIDTSVVLATDFGVPQTRKRLITRATKHKSMPLLERNSVANTSWYKAVEDMLPHLPRMPLAKWATDRINIDLNVTALVEGSSGGGRPPTVRLAHEPAFTICGGSGGRVHRIIHGGVALKATDRVNARFQTLPDRYILSGTSKACRTVIGNGVPCAMAQAIVQPWNIANPWEGWK